MRECDDEICKRIKRIIAESDNCINLLYATSCICTKNVLLYQLKTMLDEINFLSCLLCKQSEQIQAGYSELPQQNQGEFTIKELAKFNGKDGNPAYVAVNGLVYDVTNNAAWAAASHFGLTAGKDLTGEFASCHAGQAILNKLKITGKLI